MRRRILISLVLSYIWPSVSFAADDGRLRIGVFDQQVVGGRGASIEGLVRGLKKQGYDAEAISDLNMLVLLQYDVIYLSDIGYPEQIYKGREQTLHQFVASGGSVLQTWHHRIFPEVGVGIQRVFNSRHMHIGAQHPAVDGMEHFDASYPDHMIERVGKSGTVLVTNDAGQPVAVTGKIGKGKVISTGLAIAIHNAIETCELRGDEPKLLKSFFSWLKPEIPRGQRLVETLKTPKLEVARPEVVTAAGFPVDFEVRVGVTEGGDVKLTCQDATVTPKTTVTLPGPDNARISVFQVHVPTAPHEPGERDYMIRAQIGHRTLETPVKVTSLYSPPPANERRGVWLHVGKDRHPKDVMPELKKLGITMAVLRIAGGTTAFYASKVQPDIQDPLAPEGDWLAEAVKHAHANNIEIHPYVNLCAVEGRSSPESLRRLRREGRLQETATGEPIDWFCPSQEINVDAMERLMMEIVTRYDVDGILYDMIRYSGRSGCFCAKCRSLFEKETGIPVVDWPKDLMDGPRKAEWTEFRCRRISAIVRRISTLIRKTVPTVQIGAAVFYTWPEDRESRGQDWVRWCKEGWLDSVCPMNYTEDSALFAERAAVHRQVVPAGFPILQGIGIHSSTAKMKTPAELATQISLARKNGASGFIAFCYVPQHTSSLFGPLTNWLKGKP